MNKTIKAWAAVAAMGALTLAGCGGGQSDDGGSTDDASTGTNAAATAITVRGCTPQNPLIPTNTNEVCGGNVLDASEAKLVRYDPTDASPALDIAESIETEDAITWTVKLKEGYLFQDGTEVLAKNFVDAWNWGAYGPNAQMNAYFFEMIEGYDALQCADADCATAPTATEMTGLAVVDDHTFTIKTTTPTSNLEVRLGYTAFAPQPDAFFEDTSDGKTEFAKKPIAAGPYEVTAVTDTEIVLEKFADYSGEFTGTVDTVTFKVYNDPNAAYNDVVGNNLDLTDLVPTDQLIGDLWQQDAADRWGTKDTGVFQSFTFAAGDEKLANVQLRQAMSMAIDRAQITEQIFNNARTPATGWVSPVVDGYKADQCTNCVFDVDKAKELYAASGGYEGELPLWVNGDGGHDGWANAVCNQLRNNLGINCVVQTTPDFATLRNMITEREISGLFRTGWQMDYPSIENFLTPLYATGASSNDSDYSNPAFDAKLAEAAAATDIDTANTLYQEAEAMLDADLPAVPLWYQQSQYIYSDNIASVEMTPFSTFDFTSVELK
ncbi:MAG: ABC transporter substrate-binding protein [Propionibacteriaceae bacterium]|jgi:oligopeptide transport system substrate-binding protein|nr:ABC transporter substrate-binding protein [Propionibacteriaceae bacterium]